MKSIFLFCFSILVYSQTSFSAEDPRDQSNTKAFIGQLVEQHGFQRPQLEKLFKQVRIKKSIIRAMNRPAESKPWYDYRKIFVTEKRIRGGVKFWKENQTLLSKVEKQYGVAAQIIVAIIGVETGYGENTGSFRVIDALATLAFNYPRRSQFFSKELEQFLILCREENIDPLKPIGSYAGAMGLPQFMPSSFRKYAQDLDQDGKRDIWHNRGDVIASVAYYFQKHGWRTTATVAFPVTAAGVNYDTLITKDLKPEKTVAEMKSAGITIPADIGIDDKARLIKLENQWGSNYWLTLHNFYVITRYNHSTLYAMAVYQLSQEILDSRLVAK